MSDETSIGPGAPEPPTATEQEILRLARAAARHDLALARDVLLEMARRLGDGAKAGGDAA